MLNPGELAKHVANAHTGKWGGVGGIGGKKTVVSPRRGGRHLGCYSAQMVKNCSWLGPTHELTGRIEGGSVIMQSKRCPDGGWFRPWSQMDSKIMLVHSG